MLKNPLILSKVWTLADSFSDIQVSNLTPLILQLILALLLGSLLNFWQIPVPWFLGAMVVGMIYAMTQNQVKPFPNLLSILGQGIIAIATATRFSRDSLVVAHHYWFPLIFCICLTGGMSLFNGYLISKFSGIDRTTGFLGSIPGAGTSIVAMSEEMGADAIAVALLQYVRILMVALIIPVLVGYLYPNHSSHPTSLLISSSSAPLLSNLIMVTLCIGVGVWGGKRLGLPSALFLGPFLTGLTVFWLFPHSIYIPKTLFVVGLILLGLSIGIKVDRHTFKKLIKAVIIESILVLGLILSCFGVGYAFHSMTGVDPMTAILGSTPGGISAMMATVVQLNGDAGLVVAMQMTRMLLILLLSPVFATTLSKTQSFHLDH